MSDAPWDEGPVSALRARIQELTEENAALREALVEILADHEERFHAWCEDQPNRVRVMGLGRAALATTASEQRDRAVAAVRQLRAAMVTVHGKLDEVVKSYSGYKSWDFYGICFHEADRLSQMLAATAEWEAP